MELPPFASVTNLATRSVLRHYFADLGVSHRASLNNHQGKPDRQTDKMMMTTTAMMMMRRRVMLGRTWHCIDSSQGSKSSFSVQCDSIEGTNTDFLRTIVRKVDGQTDGLGLRME